MKPADAHVLVGMKKLMIPIAIGALALVLAACGGSAKQTGPTSNVLMNTGGLALYTPDGESASNVRCTGACTSIWKPLRPGDATLSGAAVITRPDGSKQLATAGKPLYTFAQDHPGAITGNGASDAFAGKRFTWHVVTSGGGATASMPASGGGASSGGY
jgi:predicted lipoprotein with Yx(FWY)xxD motif